MNYHELEGLDLRLPKVIVSPQVGSRIQGGKARLMIIPVRPQPAVCAATLGRFGIGHMSDTDLLDGMRQALNMGLLQPPIAPIRIGYAFDLQSEHVPEKWHKIGTGIVQKIGITRFKYITARHWKLCGYSSRQDFYRYWHQATADLRDQANPWCWLIEFTFKG